MSYSAPITWTPGQIVTDVQMNAQVRDNWLATFGTTGQLQAAVAVSGFTLSTGNLAIGTAAQANVGLYVTQTVNASGNQADGILISPNLVAAANADQLFGLNVVSTYNTNGKTGVICYGVNIGGPVATGASNAYTLALAAPSGASGQNIALLVTSGGITISAGGLTVTAGGIAVNGGDIVGVGEIYAASATTGMTTGFVRIAAANGAPSGTVSTVSGRAAIYYDAAANQLCVWNGVWKKTAVLT